MTFGTRRKKGNIKKMASLRNITLIDYNEGSNDDDDEEYIEEEGGVVYQHRTNIPNVSMYAWKSSTAPKRHSSPETSPSSFQKPPSKSLVKPGPATKAQRKRKFWAYMTLDPITAFWK